MYKINVLYQQSTDISIYVEQGWIQEDVRHHFCRQTQEGSEENLAGRFWGTLKFA
jgi:hypothetical protein